MKGSAPSVKILATRDGNVRRSTLSFLPENESGVDANGVVCGHHDVTLIRELLHHVN